MLGGRASARVSSSPKSSVDGSCQAKSSASLSDLKDITRLCVCFTTYLVTQIGLSDTLAEIVWPWFHQQLQPEWPTIEADDGTVAMGHPETETEDAERKDLWESAMSIAGLLHILDNAGNDVHTKAMRHWLQYKKQLETACDLLCKRYHRERFVKRCMTQATEAEKQL